MGKECEWHSLRQARDEGGITYRERSRSRRYPVGNGARAGNTRLPE